MSSKSGTCCTKKYVIAGGVVAFILVSAVLVTVLVITQRSEDDVNLGNSLIVMSSIGRGSHTDNCLGFFRLKNAPEQPRNGLIHPMDPFGTISIDYQS